MRDDDEESIRNDYPPGSHFIQIGRCFMVIGPEEADPWTRRIWLQPAPSIYAATFATTLTIGGSKNGLFLYENGHMMETVPDLLARGKSAAEMRRAGIIGENPILRALYWPIGEFKWWWAMRRLKKEYPDMEHMREERPDSYHEPHDPKEATE